MKLTIFLRRYLVLTLFSLFSTLNALDMPVFYRAPLFQGMPHASCADWTTGLAVRYGAGSTMTARDIHQQKRPLLSVYDSVDITKLGLGIETKGTKTAELWGDRVIQNGRLGSLPPLGNNGKIDINGRIQVKGLDVTLQQTLFAGLFVQAYIPVRWAKLDAIEFKNRGAEVLNQGQNAVNVATFIDQDLPTVLKESGFVFNNLRDSVSQSGVPELLISAGWAGFNDRCFDIIKSIKGSVQAGIVVPAGKQKSEDRPFEIPLGYNNFWGFNARAQGELGVWKFLAVGAGAGATVFLRQDRTLRMKTDKSQTGWIVLEKGRAEIDPGPVWDLSAYIKAENFVGGFSCLLGYSFVKQEGATLMVKDDNFLKTVVANAQNPILAPAIRRFLSKDEFVNTDQRFKTWDQHVVQLFMQYDAKAHTDSSFAPLVAVEYSYPVLGRRYFATEMIAGTTGLHVSWDF